MTKLLVLIMIIFLKILCVNNESTFRITNKRLLKPQNYVIANDDKEDMGYKFLITAGKPDDPKVLAKHVVSVRYFPQTKGRFGDDHICGGSIIAVSLILTAAHCVYIPRKGPMSKKNLYVVAGTPRRLQLTEQTQLRKLRKVIVHRRYVSFSTRYDIALLKLDRPLHLYENYVSVVPMPPTQIPNGEDCTVLGWGRMYENGPAPDEILYTNLTILSSAECERRLVLFSVGNICAADREDMEKGACRGDSGGPLICNGFLTGIVSYGFGCDSKVPDVYSDVYFFREWISENGACLIMKTKHILSNHLIIVLIHFIYYIFINCFKFAFNMCNYVRQIH